MTGLKRLAGVLLVGVGIGTPARAAVVTVSPNSLDVIVGERQTAGSATALGYYASADQGTAFPATTNTSGIGIGGSSNNQVNQNLIIGFLLPTLPAGESIQSVTLNFSVASKNLTTSSTNADLYGLGRTDPAFVPTAALFLEADADATQDKLVNNLLTNGNTSTLPNTYAATVTDFVAGLYTGQSPDGGRTEVFFRFNPDANLSVGTINRYTLTNSSSGISLTVTTAVPEPSTALLAGVAAAGIMGRRRR